MQPLKTPSTTSGLTFPIILVFCLIIIAEANFCRDLCNERGNEVNCDNVGGGFGDTDICKFKCSKGCPEWCTDGGIIRCPSESGGGGDFDSDFEKEKEKAGKLFVTIIIVAVVVSIFGCIGIGLCIWLLIRSSRRPVPVGAAPMMMGQGGQYGTGVMQSSMMVQGAQGGGGNTASGPATGYGGAPPVPASATNSNNSV